jgi:amidase
VRIHWQTAVLVASLAAVVPSSAGAVTRLPSPDGQYWDIQDASAWSQDSGGIATGGRANPFNGFGYLKLQVRRSDGTLLCRNQYLRGFGLAHDGERFDSITPLLSNGVVIERAIFAPKAANYLRYFDSFTNVADEQRVVEVAWGGAAGAFDDGGKLTVATTSNDDAQIDLTDTFVTAMQNSRKLRNPMSGPSGHGPSAHVLGTETTGVLTAVGDMYGDPYTEKWPGFDPAHVGYVFKLNLKPGETAALVTFVVKGLSEVYDPRGGFPVKIRDGLVAANFDPQYSGKDAKIPAAGSEIARVTDIARQLVREPDLSGLTPRQRAQIVNWKLPRQSPLPPFTVFEKTVSQLQEAMTVGQTTAEDIVREYLRRASRYDRNGPTFRAILALNPKAIAEARASDQERAAGGVRGPLHGIPVLYKDNIDVLGLPTTGGSPALEGHRPRLDSRVAAGMRKSGAVVLGKANLDEFPFGDFGISTLGGTIGNAYDPSLSTAGSSGGSATGVATSMAPLAFGTDTCNSLSNPSGFASLATIRVTRGLVSRAGVMPLNPYNDAVGPIAKSIRDVALVLDAVAGADAEDSATADANAHISGSFAEGLDTASLKEKRIGILRQRFIGFTGEDEVAKEMDRVAKEFEAAGATVFDVHIDEYDAKFRAARGSASGALKTAWIAYLSRGAKAGDKVLTIEDLLSSGMLAPASAARFKSALAPVPSGDELEGAMRKFIAGREKFRQLFIDVMEVHNADALLYPANVARPHTHEGGLERYGSEPGTCEESALTGLPQVTVPAGYFGGRFPMGISLLGRPWDDRKLLELAAAYERDTHHRRPPPTVKQ